MEVMEHVNHRMSEQANVAHTAVAYYENESQRNGRLVAELTENIRTVAVESEAMMGELDRKCAQKCQELGSFQEYAEKSHTFMLGRVDELKESLKRTEAKLIYECEKSEANLEAYRQLETVFNEAESNSKALHIRKLSDTAGEYREMYAETRKERETD